MKPVHRFTWALRLIIVMGGVIAVAGAVAGNEAFLTMGPVVSWLAYRLGALSVAAQNVADTTKDVLAANAALVEANKAQMVLIEALAKENADLRKMDLIRRQAYLDLRERAEAAIGAAHMVISGRK